jgi:transposase-like protein
MKGFNVTDVIAQSDKREAQERAARIRLGITSYLTTLADIRSAWDRRDWQTLGYADWDAYLDGEFSETRLRIPGEHRQKAISELRMAGMSTRAIASAVNLSQPTVAREVRQLSQMNQLEQPERVKSLDGKERPATQPQRERPEPVPPVPAAALTQPVDEPESWAPPTAEVEHAESVGLVAHPESPAAEEIEKPEAVRPVAPARPPFESSRAPEPAIADDDAAERSSAKFGEALAALFLTLDPDPIRWVANRWRPNAFANRDLPRVRDAFTSDGLRKLGDHLYALAEHLDENGVSL